jgi:DNA-binding winged helix-turn-helix (wHTH) protein/TolB-like protein
MNDRYRDDLGATRIALGRCLLDLQAGELLQADGHVAPLRRQALELLLVLGQQAGRVVGKDELMHRVWPGVVVGEGSLTQAIADVRKALGDRDHQMIRSVARRGYMLVAPGLPPMRPPGSSAEASSAPPDTAGLSADATATPPPPVSVPAVNRHRTFVLAVVSVLLVAVLGGWGWTLLRPAPSPTGPFSLVVLPLAHDGAPAESWFAQVLHHDLITRLGQLSGVLVISRETAMALPARQDTRALARDLQVRYVVSGSVRRQGERVALGLAMSDGASGAQLWARRFDIDRGQMQEALDQFTQETARSLQVQMYRSSAARSAALAPGRWEADDIAWQGWGYYFRGQTPQNYKLALERFETALARDPDSIRAWGGIQAVAGLGGMLNWMPRDQALVRLKEAVLRLQALDEDDFYTHSAKMFTASLSADWDALLVASTNAVQRFPSMPGPHIMHAGVLGAVGRFPECVQSAERAVRIGPRDYSVGAAYMYLGTCQFMQGDYQAAADAARAGHQSNPALPSPPVLLAAALVRLGQLDEARAIAREYLQRNPAYRAQDIAKYLRGRDPTYLRGRELAVESLKVAGFP